MTRNLYKFIQVHKRICYAKYKYPLKFYQKRNHNIFKINFYLELKIDFFVKKFIKI